MNKLQEIVANITSKRVYIQTHNFPDPDAISSAFGLQYLLKIYGIDAVICYKGKIDRYNTRKMIELFGISVVNVDVLGDKIYDGEVILVDAQKKSGNTYDLRSKRIICIDHHPVFENYDYCCSDIRESVGACASVIASYYFENNIDIPQNVATALIYGIKIDTAQLTRGVTDTDLEMFYRLFGIANKQHLSNLETNSVQLDDLRAYGSAIDSINVEGNVSFANTGENCPEALIAEVADFMIELKDVYFSVVYSVRKDGIKISVRSQSHSGCHAGEIVIEALEGIGTGGGHMAMAGGFVSFTDKNDTPFKVIEIIKNRFRQIVDKKLDRQLLDAM